MKRASTPSPRTPRERREDAAFAAAAEVRRRAVAFGVLMVSASVIVLFCCSRGERPALSPLTPSSSASDPPPLQRVPEASPPPALAPASAAPAPRSTERLTPDLSSAGTAGGPATILGEAPAAGGASSAGSRIGQAMASVDPRDLALLSRIERELGQAPSSAVHAILRRRREGALRSELLSLARALPELPLRVLVIRWIDEVSPAP